MPKPLRVPVEGLAPGAATLTGAIARYVSRVHRLGSGAPLLLFDPVAATEAEACLRTADARAVYCEVGEIRPSGYRPHPISLLQGLGKGQKPDQVIRDVTALGVERVVLVDTERAVTQISAERSGGRHQRWRRIAIESARQCGRGNLPSILGPMPLEQALAEAQQARRIVLAPGGKPLFERLAEWHPAISLALLVGPEGGLSASEMQMAEGAGFLSASLGSTTLRTELAGVAALGAVVALSAAQGSS